MLCIRCQIHTPTKYVQNNFQWKIIITTKEAYLNILNEWVELPPMADIVELDVIVADGEQWKSDIE